MATARSHVLPAPSAHTGFSIHQSKSHVLAGVQDAYWNDEDAEDAECPLCLEEMDISDINFKPCVCGYQICRFCWHHIKENLNKRCPACRRQYTDEGVEFKPILPQDHKRLTQQKKQRERERKELDALGRRHLANVRVVQRNVVYLVGIGPRFAKEELIPTLRSNEYFGQYGKITKIVLVKRASTGGIGSPVVGLYITYYRREDAARAIAAVDGTASPGGGRDVMRASYGTTKYCMTFLRGTSCSDHNCMNLHEWGDEKDCFTKEDLTTLKHTMKATESRSRSTIPGKKGDEADGLPRSAAWGHKTTTPTPPGTIGASSLFATQTPRSTRRGARPTRPGTNEGRTISSRTQPDRKITKPGTTSRPSTPSLPPRPATPAEHKTRTTKRSPEPLQPPSPTPSGPAGSDHESHSGLPESPESPTEVTLSSTATIRPRTTPSAPPGLPAIPPGLAAPPGLPSPARLPPRADTVSPQTPVISFQTSYQMSSAAQALLDDVKARREVVSTTVISPFPDFDRTLQNLSGGDDGFSFNLDPKLAEASESDLPDFEAEAQTPFIGTYPDAFPALQRDTNGTFATPPPGLSYPHNPSRSIYDPLSVRSSPGPSIEPQSTGGSSSYVGSFNPFSEQGEDPSSQPSSQAKSALDEETRKVSRFGFARGRQASTATSSPLHAPSPLSVSNSLAETHSFYNSAEPPHSPAPSQWSLHSRQDYQYQPPSNMPSPMLQHAQAQPYSPSPHRYQSYNDNNVSEAQLRDFIQSSRDRALAVSGMRNATAEQQPIANIQPSFNDPAIMSARFSGLPDNSYSPMDHAHLGYGPPPGLIYTQNAGMSLADGNGPVNEINTPQHPVLSSSDFPALSTTTSSDATASLLESSSLEGQQDQEKAQRRAEKRAAAAEKAAERQRLAQERAAVKALHKARIAEEKAAEEERLLALKAEEEKQRADRILLEKTRANAVREKEKAVKAEREAAEKDKQVEQSARLAAREANIAKANKRAEAVTQTKNSPKPASAMPSIPSSEPVSQVPLLSKKPKKNKPVARPTVRVPAKDDDHVAEYISALFSASPSDAPILPANKNSPITSSNNSRSQSRDRGRPTSLADLMQDIHALNPFMDLPNHPLFNSQKINPASKMPLEYGPLVHALSALSVGGGTFTNTVPSGSIDNAVSSFQQLLETLTQTISDLLRLLPRTTWDDSSSFDGVLRDMLKGDDFLDDSTTEDGGHGKDDEVAALTLALERRARWMEVQLSKLEELHRDINTAAVRAILAFNDAGWDRHNFLPKTGTSLNRFDKMGLVEEGGGLRPMTGDELEKKLAVAKEAAVFAETEVREFMDSMQAVRPVA